MNGAHFIHEGATLTKNPWGVPQFSAAFFVITGFHGFHVLSGLTILAIVAATRRDGQILGRQRRECRTILALC